jgi:hypothetical protein
VESSGPTKLRVRRDNDDPWVQVSTPALDRDLWPQQSDVTAFRRSNIAAIRSIGPEHCRVELHTGGNKTFFLYAPQKDMMRRIMSDDAPLIDLTDVRASWKSQESFMKELKEAFNAAAEKTWQEVRNSVTVTAYVRRAQTKDFVLHTFALSDLQSYEEADSYNKPGRTVKLKVREGAARPFDGTDTFFVELPSFAVLKNACIEAFRAGKTEADVAELSLSKFKSILPADTAEKRPASLTVPRP